MILFWKRNAKCAYLFGWLFKAAPSKKIRSVLAGATSEIVCDKQKVFKLTLRMLAGRFGSWTHRRKTVKRVLGETAKFCLGKRFGCSRSSAREMLWSHRIESRSGVFCWRGAQTHAQTKKVWNTQQLSKSSHTTWLGNSKHFTVCSIFLTFDSKVLSRLIADDDCR